MRFKPLIRCRGGRNRDCGTKIKEENITFSPNEHPDKYPSENLFWNYKCHRCGHNGSHYSKKILTKEYTDEEKIELFDVIYDMIETRFGRYAKRKSDGLYYDFGRGRGREWLGVSYHWTRNSTADKDVCNQLEKLFEIIPPPDERKEWEKK